MALYMGRRDFFPLLVGVGGWAARLMGKNYQPQLWVNAGFLKHQQYVSFREGNWDDPPTRIFSLPRKIQQSNDLVGRCCKQQTTPLGCAGLCWRGGSEWGGVEGFGAWGDGKWVQVEWNKVRRLRTSENLDRWDIITTLPTE